MKLQIVKRNKKSPNGACTCSQRPLHTPPSLLPTPNGYRDAFCCQRWWSGARSCSSSTNPRESRLLWSCFKQLWKLPPIWKVYLMLKVSWRHQTFSLKSLIFPFCYSKVPPSDTCLCMWSKCAIVLPERNMKIENPSSSISGSCFLSGTDYSEFLRGEIRKGKKFSPPHFCFHSQGSEKKKEREGNQTKPTQPPRCKISWRCLWAWAQFPQSTLSTRRGEHRSPSRPQEPSAGTRRLQHGLDQEYSSFPP